jgi:hypothetical protein
MGPVARFGRRSVSQFWLACWASLFGLFLTPVFYVGLRKRVTGHTVTELLQNTLVAKRGS